MERSVAKSLILRVAAEQAGSPTEDFLAVEEPLEIQLGYERGGWRVEKGVSVTMRTPGSDAELAAGFLFTEGIIGSAAQIERVHSPAANVVRVELKAGVGVDLRRLERHFYTSSSCGVCGKTSIAALHLAGNTRTLLSGPVFAAATIHELPRTLRETQAVFDQTGGLHAAALFEASGELADLREDVGRHNAVDKLIGAQLLSGAPRAFAGRLLFVSGRASFELVQKALAAGLPILAAVGAPSSLAVALAQTHGMTLLGFVRGGRFNIYAGESRIHTGSCADSDGAFALAGSLEAAAPCSA
jgi:FdhD protein